MIEMTAERINQACMEKAFGPTGLNWSVDNAIDAINLLRSVPGSDSREIWLHHAEKYDIAEMIQRNLKLPINTGAVGYLVASLKLNRQEWDQYVPTPVRR